MPDITNFGRTPLANGVGGVHGQVTLVSGGHDAPGLLALQCHNASNVLVTAYVWIDSDGVLRASAAIPTNQDTDGTVVGAQT